MANIKSAKKRAIQDEQRRMINQARTSAIKTAMKKVAAAVQAGQSKDAVLALFNDAQSQIARAKGKGVLHRNTAARKISRLAAKVTKAFATA